MITCPKCTKDNQDHYKFCLGCGAELPREVAPKRSSGTPPHGVARSGGVADETTSVGVSDQRPGSSPAAPAPVGAPPVICPQCEHPNPASNKFCASCGFKLARPAAAAVAPAAPPVASNVVLTALRADGTEAGTFALPAGTVTVGRDIGAIFAGDSYLSPRHATFTPRGGKLFVHDEGSLNGVYRKLRRDEPQPVAFGDIFRIGQEIVRFEPLSPAPPSPDGVERLGSPSKGYIGRIASVIGRDTTGNAYPIPENGLHLGRERGDVLFPEDGYVSGLHCRIGYVEGRLSLTDLGSSNGTFIRLMSEAEVHNGDVLLMGQQLFRVTV